MEPDAEALERDLAKRSRALWLAIRDARSAEDIVRELPAISRVRNWATDLLSNQPNAFEPMAASVQPLYQLSAALSELAWRMGSTADLGFPPDFA